MHPLLQTVIAVVIGASYFVLQEGDPATPLSVLSIGPVATSCLTLALSLLPLPAGFLLVRSAAAAAARNEPPRWPATRWFRSLPVLLFPVQVYVLGWPEVVNVLGIKGWVLVDKLLLFLPFAIALVLSWIPAHRLEALLFGSKTPLGKFVAFHCRMAALPCLPIFAFFLVVDIVELVEPVRLLFEYQPYLIWLVVFAFVLFLFVFFPLALRVAWGAASLPAGPLRDRLERFSRANGFSFRDILLWDTGGRILNAAILGLVGRFRYVVLSDGLLATLREDEVLPVFAHEVGHAKHHHVLLYLLFSLAYVCLLYVVDGALLGRNSLALESHPVLVFGGVLLLFGVYWGLVFGFLSRRFELEADVFAAEALGDTKVLVDTLERISRMTGRARTIWSWRHFSIANRVEFLNRFREDPSLRERFRWKLRILVGVMMVILLAGAALTFRSVREERAYALGRIARRKGDIVQAEAHFREAIRLKASDARYWIALGDVLNESGRKDGAKECAEEARRLGPLAETVRRELEALEKRIEGGVPENPPSPPAR